MTTPCVYSFPSPATTHLTSRTLKGVPIKQWMQWQHEFRIPPDSLVTIALNALNPDSFVVETPPIAIQDNLRMMVNTILEARPGTTIYQFLVAVTRERSQPSLCLARALCAYVTAPTAKRYMGPLVSEIPDRQWRLWDEEFRPYPQHIRESIEALTNRSLYYGKYTLTNAVSIILMFKPNAVLSEYAECLEYQDVDSCLRLAAAMKHHRL